MHVSDGDGEHLLQRHFEGFAFRSQKPSISDETLNEC